MMKLLNILKIHVLTESIDYKKVDEKLNQLREFTEEYLNKALKDIK